MATRGLTAKRPELASAACFVNGAWVDASEARVSAFDRGFLLGDSVFETLRTYGDDVFLPERHVDRLFASARSVRLDLPWTRTDLASLLREAWKRNRSHRAAWRKEGGTGDGVLRLTVSRGEGPFGLVPGGAEPSRVLLVQPLRTLRDEVWERGVDVHIAARRRSPPEVLEPSAKTGSLLPLVLARLEGTARGAHEVLMRNMAGRVVEGTTSNVFIVRRGGLLTPPIDEGLLPGVTRDVVLEAAIASDLDVVEAPLTDAKLASCDEAFLTSTTQEVVPVRRIDGRKFSAPGPVTTRIRDLFHARVQTLLGRKGR